MDLDFDRNIKVQCVECATTYGIDDCDGINEASSSIRCPVCSRWNYINLPELFESYIQQTIDDDEGGLLYDFRTGKLEEEFPKKHKYPTKAERVKREKEKRKIVEQLKREFKKTLGVK